MGLNHLGGFEEGRCGEEGGRTERREGQGRIGIMLTLR